MLPFFHCPKICEGCEASTLKFSSQSLPLYPSFHLDKLQSDFKPKSLMQLSILFVIVLQDFPFLHAFYYGASYIE